MKTAGRFPPTIVGVSDDRGCVVVALCSAVIIDRTPPGSQVMQLAVEPRVKIYAHSLN